MRLLHQDSGLHPSPVSPEVGLAGRQRQTPTIWGHPAQRILGLSWFPEWLLGHAFTITLTHSWFTSLKGCDLFQSDPHGSVDFGRERRLTRGTGRLALGQVHQQRLLSSWCFDTAMMPIRVLHQFHFLVPSFCVTHFLYNLLCLWKTLVCLKYFYWFISLTVIYLKLYPV